MGIIVQRAFVVAFIVFLILQIFFDVIFISAFGITCTVFIFMLFVGQLGRSIPILELIMLIACLQWIIGPLIAYSLGNDHYKYFMSLPEKFYMSFIIQCIVLFGLGMLIWRRILNKYNKSDVLLNRNIVVDNRVPFYLIFLGLTAHATARYVPGSLRFVFYLLDGVQFVSVFYFFQINHKWKWQTLWVVLLINFGISLSQGVFHDIIIWLVLLFIYLNIFYRLNLISKLLTIALGMVFVYFLQSIKGEYRSSIQVVSKTPYVEKGSNAAIFTDMLIDEVLEEEATDTTFLEVMNARLNQGWIISRVMTYVPTYEPFAKGETIKEAISASLLPRFLSTEKKKAGGKENFERFTGYTLFGTSMGVSLVGEAYANYGYNGTLLFIFIWGFFLAGVFTFITYYSQFYPSLWLWIPLMFTQVIKAETDLVVVLNYLTKSFLMVVFLFWSSKVFFNLRI